MWLILTIAASIIITAALVAGIVYFMTNKFFEEEAHRRRLELRKEAQKNTLPQQLQAYERMALFLERIKPTALVKMVDLVQEAQLYEQILLHTIQDEFEHNLAQQVYIFPKTWQLIFAAKNATQNFVRECRLSLEPGSSGDDLRRRIIERSIAEEPPSNGALLSLQNDIQGL